MKILNINTFKKTARTFMPEILAPGTGLSPLTDKSKIPTNNIPTIQDVLDGTPYVIPGGGGSWSSGRGDDTRNHYMEHGDLYKKREQDIDNFNKMTHANESSQPEKWIVKIPGGTKSCPSLNDLQVFRRKMEEQGVKIEWIKKVASNRQQYISNTIDSTFKIESMDLYHDVQETGAGFCVASNRILTCAHVVTKNHNDIESINKNVRIKIVKDNVFVYAIVMKIDFDLDLALLECNINASAIDIADENPDIGDEVVTVGSPHGIENHASFGNIGAVDKKIYADKPITHIFIDAPVFPGNSGGPIIRLLDGKCVGILTSIVSKDGSYGLNLGLPASFIKGFK
jgi:S1-C subfamily serine protease